MNNKYELNVESLKNYCYKFTFENDYGTQDIHYLGMIDNSLIAFPDYGKAEVWRDVITDSDLETAFPYIKDLREKWKDINRASSGDHPSMYVLEDVEVLDRLTFEDLSNRVFTEKPW